MLGGGSGKAPRISCYVHVQDQVSSCPLHPSWDRGPWLTAVSCPCRYEEIQQAQEELGAGMAEVALEARRALTAVEQAHADLAERLLQVAALGQVSSTQATSAGILTSCFTSAASRAGR